MNPFNHADTIQASNATAEAFTDRHHSCVTHSTIPAEEIGRSYVSPDNSLTTSPKETIMTTMYTGHVFDTSDASEILEQDEAREVAFEATSNTDTDSEFALVGRPVFAVSPTPASIDAENELASRAAKRIKNAEKLADETGDVRIGDEDELSDLGFGTLDALAGYHASEDVLETIEGETNLGLSVLERTDADSFLTLTLDDSSCLEITLHNANGWKLLAFSKAVHDFSGYDLQAQPEMQFVADSLNSTGRLLDSQGFEAIVWEDIHNGAFIRHCVNVAQALKFDLYFDKRAQKQCNRLTVKRAPGVSNKVIIAGSLIADVTPEVVLEAAVRLTGVYAYETPAAAPSAAKTDVKAVEVVQPAKTTPVKVAPPAAAKPAQQAKAAKKVQPRTKGKTGAVRSDDGTERVNVMILPDMHVPGHGRPLIASVPRDSLMTGNHEPERVLGLRPMLAASDEVTMKVVRFAKFGVIVQDVLGNEGFLGFREKGDSAGVRHDRLVVKVDDEVKVRVVSVDKNGFAKTTLLCVVDSISHYLSCLPIGDVQLGVVMRRRSEHCFYVTLGGAIDGILAVRDIPNLAEVKDKLRADTRLNVRITSVNAEKRNFHIVIESFPSVSKEATN
jgi:hypothetical protein